MPAIAHAIANRVGVYWIAYRVSYRVCGVNTTTWDLHRAEQGQKARLRHANHAKLANVAI